MASGDLRRRIDWLAGLSLKALGEQLPREAARIAGDETRARLRALCKTLEGSETAFWAQALLRAAEGAPDDQSAATFRKAYADAQYRRARALYHARAPQDRARSQSLAAKAFLRAALAYRDLGLAKDWRTALKNYASVMAIQGYDGGSIQHLDQAVRAYENCLEATNAEEESERLLWAELQSDLGYALRARGLIDNNRPALQAAVAAYQAAISVLHDKGTEAALWSRAKNSLGAGLSKLGEVETDPQLVLQAMAEYQDALRCRALESVPTLWLNTWTNILQAEFVLAKITHDTARLRRAHEDMIERLKAAGGARISPEQRAHTDRQLAGNLQFLAEKETDARRKAEDLRAAIAFYERARTNFESAGASYALAQIDAHLATAEYRLARTEGDPKRLERALERHAGIARSFPRDARPYLWAHWHQTRGVMLSSLAGFRTHANALAEARKAFEAALLEYRREVYPAQWAETASSLCRTLALSAESSAEWQECTAIADDLIETVRALALGGSSRDQQRAFLRAVQGIGDLAAYGHVKLESPARAFAVLATARAVGSDLAFRLAGGQGREAQPQDEEAFRRWQELRAALNLHMREEMENAGRAMPVRTQELQRLRALYDELLDAVKRRKPAPAAGSEMAAFAAQLPGESLAAAVFVSERGGGILTIAPGESTERPDVIDLPSLTRKRVDALIHGGKDGSGWLAAYERYRLESSGFDEITLARAVAEWNGHIESVLPALWQLVMGPLAQQIENREGLVRDVLLLVPGILSLLPLHAARADEPEAAYFIDRWAVSYLPAPGALRDKGASSGRPEALLAVTDPLGDIGAGDNPAWPFFAEGRRKAIRGTASDVEAALSGAHEASHLSFFCHGLWEASDPDRSHLVMADGSALSAETLAALDLRGIRLAVLGACESAIIGTRGTPDEYIGLPLALLQAGAGSVAASQWLVDAASTYALIHAFMREHSGGLAPARALQEAQRAFASGAMDEPAALPREALLLSQRRSLRPLSPLDSIDPLKMESVFHPPGAPPSLPRRAPFFWAAFAVVGCG